MSISSPRPSIEFLELYNCILNAVPLDSEFGSMRCDTPGGTMRTRDVKPEYPIDLPTIGADHIAPEAIFFTPGDSGDVRKWRREHIEVRLYFYAFAGGIPLEFLIPKPRPVRACTNYSYYFIAVPTEAQPYIATEYDSTPERLLLPSEAAQMKALIPRLPIRHYLSK